MFLAGFIKKSTKIDVDIVGVWWLVFLVSGCKGTTNIWYIQGKTKKREPEGPLS